MGTENIVTQLYALRAGLSLLAEETDKYENELKSIEKQKTEMLGKARKMADAQIEQSAARLLPDSPGSTLHENPEYEKVFTSFQEADEAAKKAKVARNKCQGDIDCVDRYKRYNREERAPRVLKLMFGIIFLLLHLATAGIAYCRMNSIYLPGVYFALPVLALAIGITEIIWAHQYFDDYDGVSIFIKIIYWVAYLFNLATSLAFAMFGSDEKIPVDMVTAPSIAFLISAGLCAIAVTVMTVLNYKEQHYSNDGKSKKELEEELKRLEPKYARLQAIADEHRKEHEAILEKYRNEYENAERSAEREYEIRCTKIEEQYKATCDSTAKTYTTLCTPIWDTLTQTYGGLLDIRDWKILDLVILQLETRRAETLKEALQLADRETQTDRIVGALQTASNAIRSQIRDGFGVMQSQLDYSFNMLANGFVASARYIASRIDENTQAIQLNQAAMSKHFNRLYSQSSLQTALLEKAETSSTQLVSAVNKLRDVKFQLESK